MTINWSGKRRWIALLLLLAGIAVTIWTPPVIPVIQLPGEVYPSGWKLFGLIPMPNNIVLGSPMTNTMMGSIVVWVLLGLLMFYVSRNMPKSWSEVPRGGFYNFFEMVFEGLYDFISGIAGGNRFFPTIFRMFATIFFIVLLSNWQSIIPGVDSIGFIEPHLDKQTGEPLEGHDVYRTFFGASALNPKCPWVSPEESALLTEAERQTRIANGCRSGISAEVEQTEAEAAVSEEAVVPAESAATEGEAAAEATVIAEGTAVEGEATVIAEGTAVEGEATAVAEGEETQVEGGIGEETGEGEAAAEGEEEHYAPGDPSVPWVALPFLRPPSTDLSMTLALALCAVVMTQVMGFRALGLGYLTKFFNFKTLFTSPLGGIDVAVGLLELIGEIARILSFSFRLLGNVFAGSVLLFVMSFLLPFLPWPFFILEFFVGVIQALVFGLLTAIFMNLATIGHGHDDEHPDEGHAEEGHAESVAAH